MSTYSAVRRPNIERMRRYAQKAVPCPMMLHPSPWDPGPYFCEAGPIGHRGKHRYSKWVW